MKYYYYRIVKPIYDINGDYTGINYYGPVKKVRISSKKEAKKEVSKKYPNSKFKFISKIKAVFINRRK